MRRKNSALLYMLEHEYLPHPIPFVFFLHPFPLDKRKRHSKCSYSIHCPFLFWSFFLELYFLVGLISVSYTPWFGVEYLLHFLTCSPCILRDRCMSLTETYPFFSLSIKLNRLRHSSTASLVNDNEIFSRQALFRSY